MKKALFFIIFFIIFTGGCSAVKSGNDLYGFCMRSNELTEEFQMSPEGFIVRPDNDGFYRFFKCQNCEIMLSFDSEENGELKAMDIVFSENADKDAEAAEFGENCIRAFIKSESGNGTDALLAELKLAERLNEPNFETEKIRSGNVCIETDVTGSGTVLTVKTEN